MNRFRCAAMSALLATMMLPSLASAADSATVMKPSRHLISPHRAFVARGVASRTVAAPSTRESVSGAVDRHVEQLFDRAADPATHLATTASAEKSGLGFLVDHFAEIDRDYDGNLRFSEVKLFLDARSPVAKPAFSGAVQIIE